MTEPDPNAQTPVPDAALDPIQDPAQESVPDPGTPAPDASSEPALAGAPEDVPSADTSGTPEQTPSEPVEPTLAKAGDIADQSVTQLNASPDSALVVDAAGITRLAAPADSTGWTPAPTESDPAERERLEKLQFELASRDKARLES